MSTYVKWIIAAVGLFVLALFTVRPFVPRSAPGAPAKSDTAARSEPSAACDADAKPANLNFTLKDMHGNDVPLAQYKGKVILLDFWATWCGPCKLEIPWFVEFQNTYNDKGLVVLGLSVDDPVEKLKPFAAEFKMNYPVLVGREHESFEEAYGPIWGIPTTFVIDRQGMICKKHTGVTTREQFEKDIAGLL